MFDDCLIMAGGSGTRLWPASNSRLPKQFLPAGAGKSGSFFYMALERALSVIKENGTVIVITGLPQVSNAVSECAKLAERDKERVVIIGEPVAKNTAPAIACALAYSLAAGQNRTMLVLTADHIIEPLENFKADAALAAAAAAEGKLAVFGITPGRAETGYGYIETAGPGAAPPGAGAGGVLPVAAFREKPDLPTAQEFAVSGRHFWNSGMFAFDANFMLGEFSRHAADVLRPFEALKKPPGGAYAQVQGVKVLSWPGLETAYQNTKSISFDYAIAEKCAQTAMVRGSFNWVDIGNWEDYARLRADAALRANAAGGVEVFTAAAADCYVDSDIPVALAGVDDLIVVIRSGKNGEPAAALVTRKGQTQNVRDVVEAIKKSGRADLL